MVSAHSPEIQATPGLLTFALKKKFLQDKESLYRKHRPQEFNLSLSPLSLYPLFPPSLPHSSFMILLSLSNVFGVWYNI